MSAQPTYDSMNLVDVEGQHNKPKTKWCQRSAQPTYDSDNVVDVEGQLSPPMIE